MQIFGKNISRGDFIPPVVRILLNKHGKKPTYINKCFKSYSQYNEDLLLDIFFNMQTVGTYIDVGANDPEIFSNTKRFYDRGWTGVNIEPNPLLHKKLSSIRTRDININAGISSSKGELEFYIMSADTLSSFDKNAAINSGKMHGAELIGQIVVPVLSLSDVFEKYIKNVVVDFLSIDAEEYDIIVLNSNDWKNYRPKIVMVEVGYDGEEIINYMSDKNYQLIYNNNTNGIFVDNKLLLI